jgi:hypothetical protein
LVANTVHANAYVVARGRYMQVARTESTGFRFIRTSQDCLPYDAMRIKNVFSEL